MANFTKPFTDFSLGEISPRNLSMVTSQETSKGVSFLENAFTNSLKELERRTGSIKVASTIYPVASTNQFCRCMDFFIGRNNSYVAMMYFSLYGELTPTQKGDVDSLIGIPSDDTSLILMMDFYKSTGTSDTYLNTLAIPLDNTDSNYHYYSRDIFGYPSTLGTDWKDLYGFNLSKFQAFSVMTHNSGLVEPIVLFFNSETNQMDYFLHSEGMYQTNKSYYPVPSIVRPFGLPFNQANLNPNIAIEVEQHTETDIPSGMWFKLTAKYYDPDASDYVDWSTYTADPDKPNPFDKFARYIRLTIGGNQYVLRYVRTLPSNSQFLDLTLFDEHIFALTLDSKAAPLQGVVGTAQITTDFQVEMFNRVDAYPDTSIIYDQRLVFHRDGRLINTGVGNAFFLHQYRFAQDTIVGVYTIPTGAAPGSPQYDIVSYDLLIDYSGQKIQTDAFDFNPLSETLPDVSWLNKGNNLELGGATEVLNVSGLEDSIYSFASIRSITGAAHGSKSAISVKAGSDTIFVDGDNRSIRNFYYDGRTRNYVSNNLNNINPGIVEHLMDESVNTEDVIIKEMSYDNDNTVLYCIVGPHNTLVGLTYHRDSELQSWHRVTLGNEDNVKVDVFSSCFLRNDKSSNVRYVVTLRDGKFWLERFAYRYNKAEMNPFQVYGGSVTTDKLPVYLDFASRFVGPTSNTWNIGLDYANKTVDVFGDGFWIGKRTASALGVITLDREVRTLVVGYTYGSDIIFMEVEPNFGGANGSFLHYLKSYNYVHLRLYKSFGGKITNTSVNQLEKIPYSNDDMIVNVSLKLFTGAVNVHLSQASSVDNKFRIFTDAPYPFILSSALVKGDANER